MQNFEINSIIVHYGEIGLKGKNQPLFRKKLKSNIKNIFRSRSLNWPVSETRGYLSVTLPEKDRNKIGLAEQLLRKIPGIVWFTPAQKVAYDDFKVSGQQFDFELLKNIVIDLARRHYKEAHSFCVRVKRTNKNFPAASLELEKQLGAAIIQETEWERVNLTKPDATFSINIQENDIFIFCGRNSGISGLPVGTVGSVLTLLSGGIDSPVAAYLAARRGCTVDFIHFTATMMQQREARAYKITRLAQHLSNFTMKSTLYLVPYIHFDMAMFGKNVEYELVLFRRFMVRVAQKLTEQTHHEALVTGDNLAQVASQTLPNLVATSKAAQLPILRPLLTYDKQDIIDLAKTIDTYRTSIEPYKDCCAIISRNPKTKSKADFLEKMEKRLFGDDYEKMIADTLNDMVSLEFKYGELYDSERE